MYERALTLNPTPQPRLRLRLELGEKLIAADRKADARRNYEKLLEENPGYANEVIIQQKIAALLPKPQ
jgi:tetratricopeptide (TPR) repeat protein